MDLLDADSADTLAMDDFMDDINEDPEFDWDTWLKQSNLEVIPEACLPHVHKKAKLILEAGMKIEFAYMEEEKPKYWVATVIMSLGPVVRLRYLGDTDVTRDKWVMINSFKFHPLGWAARCNVTLNPPAYRLHVNKEALLEELKVQESNTVQEYATFEYQQFVPGMKVEIDDELRPYQVWVANILENYGGRLQLRYDTPNPEEPTFWLFYTSPRIHPFGWTKSQGTPWSLEKPDYMKEQCIGEESWAALLEMNKFNFEMECKISHIKNYKYEPPMKHEFNVGQPLEVVHPQAQDKVSPATVVQVFDKYYFLVQVDGSDLKFLATGEHPYIFPSGWAASHGVKQSTCDISSSVQDPLNFIKQETWYKKSYDPHIQLTPGMKLEVVNPLDRSQMCVGTISCVYDRHVLVVNIDIQGANTQYLFHLMGCEVFPLGWSKSTGHPILPPHTSLPPQTKAEPAVVPQAPAAPIRCHGTEKITIYLNYKCFTGPFLSKSKLASLPKQVGPGPVKLVLLNVVKRIANLAYVQMRILRELEASNCRTRDGRTREELKVKYKKRLYKGVIEVASKLDTVESYCMEICKKLQTCPNLISTKLIPECPLNCSERNKVKSGKDKKANTKQPIDYKSFIYKPLINPVTLVNRKPFQEDIPPPKDVAMEDVIVYNKEKCLRKRKVNVFLEREKKRLKLNDEEERGSGRGKESEENNSGEEELKKPNRGRPPLDKLDEKPLDDKPSENKPLDSKEKENKLSIYQRIKIFERKKLPLPDEIDPINWTIDDVFQCVSQVPEIRAAASALKAGAIDGEALTLLHWKDFRQYFNLDSEISIYLCSLVQRVRFLYYIAKLPRTSAENF